MKTKAVAIFLTIALLLSSCANMQTNNANSRSSHTNLSSISSTVSSSVSELKDYTEEELLQIIKDSVDEVYVQNGDDMVHVFEEDTEYEQEKLKAKCTAVNYDVSVISGSVRAIIIKTENEKEFKKAEEWGVWTTTTDSAPSSITTSKYPYIIVVAANTQDAQLMETILSKF